MTTDTITLQKIVDLAIRNVSNDFALSKTQEQDLAVCVVDMSDGKQLHWAGFRDDEPVYPASVAKLFFAIAAYHWLEEGKIERTADFERAMRDMIVDSSNDASSYIIDLITGTTSGPELSDAEMKLWTEKRDAVNAYFAKRGFQNFNLCQKPVADGRYGRERVSIEKKETNKLTAKMTAQLITEIIEEKAVKAEYCKDLFSFMKRDRSVQSDDPNSQAHAFLGYVLPPGANYWSKAGWTDDVRHDAAYVELVDGKKLCLVIFTCNQPYELLSAIGAEIITALELL